MVAQWQRWLVVAVAAGVCCREQQAKESEVESDAWVEQLANQRQEQVRVEEFGGSPHGGELCLLGHHS